MATPLVVTVTVTDEDGFPVPGAAVEILDPSGALAASGATDSSGVYQPTIATTQLPSAEWRAYLFWRVILNTQLTPAQWRAHLWPVQVKASGYHKAGGFLVFDSESTAKQNFYLVEDRG